MLVAIFSLSAKRIIIPMNFACPLSSPCLTLPRGFLHAPQPLVASTLTTGHPHREPLASTSLSPTPTGPLYPPVARLPRRPSPRPYHRMEHPRRKRHPHPRFVAVVVPALAQPVVGAGRTRRRRSPRPRPRRPPPYSRTLRKFAFYRSSNCRLIFNISSSVARLSVDIASFPHADSYPPYAWA